MQQHLGGSSQYLQRQKSRNSDVDSNSCSPNHHGQMVSTQQEAAAAATKVAGGAEPQPPPPGSDGDSTNSCPGENTFNTLSIRL